MIEVAVFPSPPEEDLSYVLAKEVICLLAMSKTDDVIVGDWVQAYSGKRPQQIRFSITADYLPLLDECHDLIGTYIGDGKWFISGIAYDRTFKGEANRGKLEVRLQQTRVSSCECPQ